MNVIEDGTQGEVLRAKVVTMVVLFVVSMIFGCIPMLISLKFNWFTNNSDNSNLKSSNQLVMGLLAFGGGVLFATTFMHLLPEVDENIRILQEAGQIPEMDLYLVALIMCGGFFMLYLVEELVHVYINSRENKSANTSFSRTLSIRSSSRRGAETSSADDTHKLKEVRTIAKESEQQPPAPAEVQEDPVVVTFRGLLIVLALSIHELFEGLAVGLESSASNVWYMFGAVSSHKYIIAFCIGVELLSAKTRTWLSLVYIFTFSFVSALGIGVGILLVGGAGASAAGLSSVVLQGLACGTLVYVVFFEVWRQDRSGLQQFLCSLLGFSVMVGLQVLIGH